MRGLVGPHFELCQRWVVGSTDGSLYNWIKQKAGNLNLLNGKYGIYSFRKFDYFCSTQLWAN